MEKAAFAMNALKRRKDDKRRQFIAKEFRASMLDKASTWLNEAKKTNNGKLPYGKMLEVIQDLANNGVHVTRDALNRMVGNRIWFLRRRIDPMMKKLSPAKIMGEVMGERIWASFPRRYDNLESFNCVKY